MKGYIIAIASLSLVFYTYISAVSPVQAVTCSTANCLPSDYDDVECAGSPTSSCPESGENAWIFTITYYCKGHDPCVNDPRIPVDLCSFQWYYYNKHYSRTTSCNAADRCCPSSDPWKVCAGICDDSDGSCKTGGWYKSCCKADGSWGVCSGGFCSVGTITGVGIINCPVSNEPTPTLLPGVPTPTRPPAPPNCDCCPFGGTWSDGWCTGSDQCTNSGMCNRSWNYDEQPTGYCSPASDGTPQGRCSGCTCFWPVCNKTASGSCTVTCGAQTYYVSCYCGGNCGSNDTCSNGLRCNTDSTRYCCVNQAPLTKPQIASVTQPIGVFGEYDEGGIIQTRSVVVNWTFNDTGDGCGKAWGYKCYQQADGSYTMGNTDTFKIKITGGITQTLANIPKASRAYLTGSVLNANASYTVQVCADNGFGENCSIPVTFNKVAYPSGRVTGPVGERDAESAGNECTTGASGNISFSLNAPSMAGITSLCTTTTSGPITKTTGYSCNITLNNTSADPDPKQTFTLSASGYNLGLYSGLYCNPPSTCGTGSCGIAIDLDQNGGTVGTTASPVNKDAHLNILAGASYYKLKNAGYQDRDALDSPFPVTILPYDAVDDTGQNYLIIGTNTVIGAAVSAAHSLANATVSQRNWFNNSYAPRISMSAQSFIAYVKSRKEYKTITSLNNLENNTIHVLTGSLTINNQTDFNDKNLVLIVDGTVEFYITDGDFLPNQSIAIVAQKINFYQGSNFLTSARGIFIANEIDLGDSDTPLKIVGNLSSTESSLDTTKRHRTDGRMPSLFIVANPIMNLDLLPYLSTAKYEWKQLQ